MVSQRAAKLNDILTLVGLFADAFKTDRSAKCSPILELRPPLQMRFRL